MMSFICSCRNKKIATATPHGDTPASGSRDAVSLTTNEADKNVLANATFSHRFQTRAEKAHDIDSLKDTPPSQPDTKKCIQVGSETYAVTSQPGTPYTFDPRIDTGTILGQRLQPITEIPEHTTQEVTRWKSTKPQKPNRHKNRRNKTHGRSIDSFSTASRP